MSRLLRFSLAGLAVCLMLWAGYYCRGVSQKPLNPQPSGITRHLRYGFELRNTSGQPLEKVTFRAFLPAPRTPHQQLISQSSSHAYEIINDSNGNRLLQFRISNLPPFGTKIVTISAVVEMQPAPRPERLKDPTVYLMSQRLIESDHPLLKKTAQQFQTDPSDEPAQKIQQWVHQHVADRGYLRQDQGALYALKHKTGDCTEFATLFTALCRASDIPARVMGGYVCETDQVLQPETYHNWAEYYDGHTWQIADPQNNLLKPGQGHYVAFQELSFTPQSQPFFHRFWCDAPQVVVKMKI